MRKICMLLCGAVALLSISNTLLAMNDAEPKANFDSAQLEQCKEQYEVIKAIRYGDNAFIEEFRKTHYNPDDSGLSKYGSGQGGWDNVLKDMKANAIKSIELKVQDAVRYGDIAFIEEFRKEAANPNDSGLFKYGSGQGGWDNVLKDIMSNWHDRISAYMQDTEIKLK